MKMSGETRLLPYKIILATCEEKSSTGDRKLLYEATTLSCVQSLFHVCLALDKVNK